MIDFYEIINYSLAHLTEIFNNMYCISLNFFIRTFYFIKICVGHQSFFLIYIILYRAYIIMKYLINKNSLLRKIKFRFAFY